MLYLSGFLANPKLLPWEFARLQRRVHVEWLLFPWVIVRENGNVRNRVVLTSDILLGRVIITEYPLSIVFSTHSREVTLLALP